MGFNLTYSQILNNKRQQVQSIHVKDSCINTEVVKFGFTCELKLLQMS